MQFLKFKPVLLIGISFTAVSLTSCATLTEKHGHQPGSILSLSAPDRGTACVEDFKSKLGDQLVVSENRCKEVYKASHQGSRQRSVCTKEVKGSIEVLSTDASHIVEFKAIESPDLRIGQRVEPKR